MKRMIGCLVLVCLCAAVCFPVCCRADGGGIPVGGIRLLMTDVTGSPLEGAAFQILRDATNEELGDSRAEKKMVRIGEEHRIMVVESFWTSLEMSGEKQSKTVTASDGTASVYGLKYGTYYLLETDAPDGYNRIREPVFVTVHKYSHLSADDGIRDVNGKLIDNTLHIVNLRYTLPDTGQWGTVPIAAAGTALLFSSAALILMAKRRK